MKAITHLSIVLFILLAGCAKETVVIPPVEKAAAVPPAEVAVEELAIYVDPPPYATYFYVVRPGDWLSKIALAEYGDTTQWHNIYAWNRSEIGDNPNFIYPYREFQLRKPEDEVARQYQLFGLHFVQKGESLWSIAAKVYGDPTAWLLIFHDNRPVFTKGIGLLDIGLKLRIRKPLK